MKLSTCVGNPCDQRNILTLLETLHLRCLPGKRRSRIRILSAIHLLELNVKESLPVVRKKTG